MCHQQLLSQQLQCVNHAMQQLNIRAESVLRQDQNQEERRTKPSTCYVCANDATYEAGVAVSIVNVVGMSEWHQQWRFLLDSMRAVEQTLRQCIVAPPEERMGPRFTTCQRCAACTPSIDPKDNDADDEAPLQPFVNF
jgi:predicted RecB family nuclease